MQKKEKIGEVTAEEHFCWMEDGKGGHGQKMSATYEKRSMLQCIIETCEKALAYAGPAAEGRNESWNGR